MEGFSLDKESGAVNRETTGNDKPLEVNNACVDIPQESNLENDILLQTCGSDTERRQRGNEDMEAQDALSPNISGRALRQQVPLLN